MPPLVRDFRHAWRALARRPGVTVLAIVSLAVAIGLSTAVFSALDAYLLRDLPVSDPAHLVRLSMKTREQRIEIASWSEYQALAAEARGFSGVIAEDRISPSVHLPDGDDFPITAGVSDNYFDVLGVKAARGGVFHSGRGQDGTVVLSYHYWHGRLASDPHIIGRILPVGHAMLRVVGVTPPGFQGTNRGLLVDLYVPPQTFFGALNAARPDDLRYADYEIVARLRPSATLDSARAESEAILRQVERDGLAPAPERKAVVEPFSETKIAANLEASAVVLGTIVLLLVVAAANLANLRLVDNETRRHETGIRLALGAGRSALFREHLAESLLLSGAGTALGLLIASWLVAAAPALFYFGRRYLDFGIRLDARAFAFSSGALLLVALLGALIPLSDAWRHRVMPSLQAARATRPTRWLAVLVIAQMAVVTAVTCSAGLFWRSLEKISAIRPAMDPGRSLLLVQGGFSTGDSLAALPPRSAALAESLSRLPGIHQVAWARRAMLSGSGGGATVNVEMPGQPKFAIPYNQVSANYFAATGARLLSGRAFRDSDSPEAAPVVLVSQTFARRFFPGRDPMGQWVRIAGKDRQIIGIVEDGPQNFLLERIQPYAYFPYAQRPQWDLTLFIETQRDPASLAASVHAFLRSAGFTIFEITPMRDHMRGARSGQEMACEVSGALAATGLLLAAAGLFGVTLFAVARRMPEFGIRMAMGATPRRLARQVLVEAGRRIAIALPLGWLLAWLARHAIGKLLYGIAPDDPWTFAAASGVVCLIGCLAALHPALRAAHIDPARALRQE